MKTLSILFDKVDPKKHSIRYDAADDNAPVRSIYIKRQVLGGEFPFKVMVTIEEVSE